MPAPEVEFVVEDTSAGRRVFLDQATGSVNAALQQLFELIANIPAGPIGPQGLVGPTGPAWITGTPRAYAEGLVCTLGNIIYRQIPSQRLTAVFRCTVPNTITSINFPAVAASNANWELVTFAPWGEVGEQGPQGIQGIQGVTGNSATIVQFATDAEAIAYSTANPLAFVISTEGAA